MGLDPASRVRFNLSEASILLFDGTPMGMSILVQILTGFGAKTLHRCSSLKEAQTAATENIIDLAVVDATTDGAGYDFIEWLRSHGGDPNSYTPVLLTAGHTPVSDIQRARDCGAHFALKKPLSPIAVLERIIWISREGRMFLLSDTYVGPDRRFKDDGAPNGGGRRREDLARQAQAEAQARAESEGAPP
ncbi:MAG: response regulator [Caulobacteraceae bacterium]